MSVPPPPSGRGGDISADLDEIKKMLGSIMEDQANMKKKQADMSETIDTRGGGWGASEWGETWSVLGVRRWSEE
jgi:hypothetical protein